MLKRYLLIIWLLSIFCKIYANDFSFGNLISNQIDDSYQNNSSAKLIRTKRNVFQLSNIIKCMTGCKALSYTRYGCFCGYKGEGSPVDDIDRCCEEHDHCYSSTSCAQIMVYLLPYKWKCTEPGDAKCTSPPDTAADKCAYQLCECDRMLGSCLKQYECPLNKPICDSKNVQKDEY